MTNDLPVRKEVSCLALTFFYDYLESRGIDRARLQAGLPYGPAYLDDRFNWIDFGTFQEMERRVRVLVPDEPDLFFQIGRSLSRTQGFGFLKTAARVLVAPLQVYNRLPTFVNRFLFPVVTIEFEQRGPNALRGRYTLPPPYTQTEAWMDTARGILTAVPEIVGAPPATVVMTRVDDHVSLYDIDIHEWKGLRDRMRGWLGGVRRGLVARDEAAEELVTTNQLLAEKVEALSSAKAQLDQRVADLTLLNTLAHTVASELDLPRLVGAAADTIHAGLGGPLVLLVAEGEPPALVLAATRGATSDEVAEVLALADDAVAAARPGDAELEKGRWLTVPMTSHDRIVGAMFLRPPTSRADPGLLASLASQLAVAVENAISFRTIAELRDHLDLRVRERTAELEEARTQLEDTVTRLVQADQAKASFFTNVSHELRTPLTLILGPVQDLEAQVREPEARAHVQVIRRNALQLLGLVNEVLDFARLDAGAMPMERETLDLAALVDDVVSTLAPLATRKGLQLGWVLPSQVVAIRGDPRLLRRVIVNLLGNAVKYCHHGDRVTVRVEHADGEAIVEVADTGPGIPSDEQERVFERFHRARHQVEGGPEGSGIGLAMAADIARAHNGSIQLRSAPGAGSTFRLVLPAETAAAPLTATWRSESPPVFSAEAVDLPAELPEPLAAQPAASGPAPRTRVLLVEDNPDMRNFVARLLARHHQVLAVRDGEEALEVAEAEVPDVVIADVMMPRMDGFTLCRRLRASGATRNIPVILLSARHGTEAAIEGFEAGADDYVTKPFSGPELLARINAQVRIRTLALAMMRMEKQSSLGVLSAGVAHELLNPVNAVVNSVPPLRRMVERAETGGGLDPVRMRALLDAVELSGTRMSRVIRDILAYTRHDVRPRATRTRIGEQVEVIASILRFRLERGCRLHTEFRWDEPFVHHPDLVGQVLMNLLSNAMDAMEGRGNIWVRTEREGDLLRVRVRDDGPGVPASARERIFDPFFTTKPPGAGTGLGLAISREIATMHGGTLELDASVPLGACFVLSLPITGSESTARDRGAGPQEGVAAPASFPSP